MFVTAHIIRCTVHINAQISMVAMCDIIVYDAIAFVVHARSVFGVFRLCSWHIRLKLVRNIDQRFSFENQTWRKIRAILKAAFFFFFRDFCRHFESDEEDF